MFSLYTAIVYPTISSASLEQPSWHSTGGSRDPARQAKTTKRLLGWQVEILPAHPKSPLTVAILHAEDFIRMSSFARFVTRAKRLPEGGMNRERDQINTKPAAQPSPATPCRPVLHTRGSIVLSQRSTVLG